ncbi:MAG TPA: hypothetical protein VMR02_15895 [Terracidiphilus sp.]|nr:hypothetical protein [Terracidiphilus sp.]
MRLVIGRFMAAAALAALSLTTALHAQDFNIGNRPVQVHGFASQGYGYSNQNNFLTMNTSHGSPAFTEGALNLSMPISDKFRIDGQGYTRKIGSLDDFKPQLDWAYGDYKIAPWVGMRAGKVKTALGLYNDTQDMEFLHTWALLPQSIYPTDLRTTFIAHTGGDLYGRIPLKKAGLYGLCRITVFRQPRRLLLLLARQWVQHPVDQRPHGGVGSEVDDTGQGLDAGLIVDQPDRAPGRQVDQWGVRGSFLHHRHHTGPRLGWIRRLQPGQVGIQQRVPEHGRGFGNRGQALWLKTLHVKPEH